VRSDAALAVLLVELHFPGSRSLKDKRAPLASLRDVVQGRFRASFSEVGQHDTWQRSEVLIALAASSLAQARQRLDEIERYLHGREFEVARTIVRTVESAEALCDADCCA